MGRPARAQTKEEVQAAVSRLSHPMRWLALLFVGNAKCTPVTVTVAPRGVWGGERATQPRLETEGVGGLLGGVTAVGVLPRQWWASELAPKIETTVSRLRKGFWCFPGSLDGSLGGSERRVAGGGMGGERVSLTCVRPVFHPHPTCRGPRGRPKLPAQQNTGVSEPCAKGLVRNRLQLPHQVIWRPTPIALAGLTVRTHGAAIQPRVAAQPTLHKPFWLLAPA